MSRDIYEEITSSIITAIERDPGNPVMPWHRDASANRVPMNVATEATYNGVNILNLWVEAQVAGHTSNQWGTYRQWREVGAQVRKGERASVIVFYKSITKTNEEGEDESYRLLKYYTVFNACQVDGWATGTATVDTPLFERLEEVENAIAATGAYIREGGDCAYYAPSGDFIQMPDRGRFFDTKDGNRSENFYAVLLHELTHWTGHTSRCDRNLRNRFGSEAYAMEELVAELGAAFLCARLGISSTPREDHAAYVGNWLSVLKSDKKAIFTAAAQAQVAVDHVL